MRDELKLDRLLNDVAAKALQATGATGVAIGLGREDAMICYAATGLPFADLGVRINTESGLTAAAIRRQMSQWCSDTESDSRVDIEVCRQLGARSIIVVPVCVRDTVVGVIAIFSANPDAFSLRHLNSVKELAQLASEAIETTTVEDIAPPTTRACLDTPGKFGASDRRRQTQKIRHENSSLDCAGADTTQAMVLVPASAASQIPQ